MSGERIILSEINTIQEYVIFLKEKFIYNWTKELIGRDDVCLDLGCGDGYGTKLLAATAREVVGVDIDERTIERAGEKYGSENCKFQKYDGKKLPFPEGTFDLVACFHVIEHVRDDISFISEIFRVLKKGGNLILSTPNKILRLPRNQKPWNIYHVREYNPLELESVLKKVFKDVSLLGISAREDIMEFEKKRSQMNLKIAALDFLNLRRITPRRLTREIIKLLHLFLNLRRTKSLNPHSLLEESELFKISQDLENCLDILALCKK